MGAFISNVIAIFYRLHQRLRMLDLYYSSYANILFDTIARNAHNCNTQTILIQQYYDLFVLFSKTKKQLYINN